MELLPVDQQKAVFDAMRSDPLLADAGTRFVVPEITVVQDMSGAELSAWLSDAIAAKDVARAEYDDAWDTYSKLPAVLDHVVTYSDDNQQEAFMLPASDDVAGHQDAVRILHEAEYVVPSAQGGWAPEIRVGQGALDGYDVKITREQEIFKREGLETRTEVYDFNTEVLADVDDPEFLHDLGMPDGFGVRSKQDRFAAQLRALTSGGERELDLLQASPFYAAARRTARSVLGHENFAMQFHISQGRPDTEARPMVHEEPAASVEPVDISGIEGDLAYHQEGHNRRLYLFGQGIVEGPVYNLDNPDKKDPVPEGSVVLIRDEFGMGNMPPVVFDGAAALVTRGYTGERGVKIAALTAGGGGSSEHIEIIGRSLADQVPNFIYFKTPHMNPGDSEHTTWQNLWDSTAVTVASDGKNIKIRSND